MKVLQIEENLRLEKIRERLGVLRPVVYAESVPVKDIAMYRTPGREPFAEASRGRFSPCRLPFRWGEKPESIWVRLRFEIPRAWRGRRVELRIKPDGEAVIFNGGVPVQGLDPNRDEFLLADRAAGGERWELLIEAGSYSVFGRHESRVFEYAEVVAVNEPLRQAWFDLDTLTQLAEAMPAGTARRSQLVEAINTAMVGCPFGGSEAELAAWAARARRTLRPAMAARNTGSVPEIGLNGHAHIDVAWLWPYAETVRKCSRTFSTVIKLMEQYPDYIFTQSQPQLYAYTRKHYPGLYAKILKRVREGRWEAAGGMWVESDCNLAGGEALVRQVLHGKRFLREELGTDTTVCWLPDVFGFPASMPQILAKGGLPHFYTIKIDWNEVDRFPYPCFWWQGIDGSRVLTHLGANPAGYNGKIRAADLRKTEEFLSGRDGLARVGLFAFGFGDGGGGPTREMLEFSSRARDLEGLPRTRQIRADEFFRQLEKEGARLPEWAGELYLELHRGTLTTQARTKRANRKAELALREVELLSTLVTTGGGRYPARELDAAWKLVLLNQFHDVLPGSSIGEVYKDNLEHLAEVRQSLDKLSGAALASLGARMDSRGPGKAVMVTNSLSWPRGGVVELDAPAGDARVLSESGAELVVQRSGRKLLVQAQQTPAMGAAVWHVVDGRGERVHNPLSVDARRLENEFLRVRFDAQGLITSIFDKRAGREVLPAGKKANLLELFEDRPRKWDAWDIDLDFTEDRRELTALDSVRVVERGPVRAALRMVRRFGKSRLEQDVRLAAGSGVLEFVTRVDWQEDRKLLKAAFPLDVHAERATYEIQFGAIERSTLRNTSWDRARFEVCAHRWADLSEPGYGASLLNDCKYGYDCRGNVLRLSLLRAPVSPDPKADRGEHEFTYALYPHSGDWRGAGTVRAGLELNVPLGSAPLSGSRRGALGTSASFLSVDSPNVVIEAVKRAESSDDVVVRLYEAHGARANARLRLSLPVASARETDLLESGGRKLEVESSGDSASLRLDFRPFEIKTVVLKLT